MKIAPKIKLEVLNSSQLYGVLLSVNVAVLIAVFLSFFYTDFEIVNSVLNSAPVCNQSVAVTQADFQTALRSNYFGTGSPPGLLPSSSCLLIDGSDTSWSVPFHVSSSLNLFFSVDAVLQRDAASAAYVQASSLPVHVSIRSLDSKTEFASVWKYTKLECASLTALCSRVNVLSEADYMYRIDSQDTVDFYVSISFVGWNPLNMTNSTSFAFLFQTHSSGVISIEVYVRTIGLVLTILSLCYWFYAVRQYRALKARSLLDWRHLFDVTEEYNALRVQRNSLQTPLAPFGLSPIKYEPAFQTNSSDATAPQTDSDLAAASHHEVSVHDCVEPEQIAVAISQAMSAAGIAVEDDNDNPQFSYFSNPLFQSDPVLTGDQPVDAAGSDVDIEAVDINVEPISIFSNPIAEGIDETDSIYEPSEIGDLEEHDDAFTICRVSYHDPANPDAKIGIIHESPNRPVQRRKSTKSKPSAEVALPTPAFHFSESASQAALFGIIRENSLILFEQKWIPTLLFALALYQNPVYAVRAFKPSPELWLVSGICYSLAAGMMMTFLLVLIRELGNDHQQVQARRQSILTGASTPRASVTSTSPKSTAPIPNESSSVLGCLSDELDPLSAFYNASDNTGCDNVETCDIAPYIFLVVYEGVSLSAVVLNAKNVASVSATSLTPSIASVQAAMQVNLLQYIGVGLVALWVVWFAISAYIAGQHLKRLPYMAYRYRQLAFRMFGYMSVAILVYLLTISISAAASVLSGGGTNYTNSLGDASIPTFILFSIYVYLSAYIYLPETPVALNLPPLLDIAEMTLADRVHDAKQSIMRFLTSHFPHAATVFEEGHHTARAPAAILASEWNQNATDTTQNQITHVPELEVESDSDISLARRATAAAHSLAASATQAASTGLENLVSIFHDAVHAVISDSPADPMKRFSFHTARSLCTFAWEAYYSQPNIAATGFELIEILEDQPTDTFCFIAVKNENIVISFRGSASLQNLLTDLQLSRTDMSFADHQHSVFAPKIHSGFSEAYHSIRLRLLKVIALIIGRPAAAFLSDSSPEEPSAPSDNEVAVKVSEQHSVIIPAEIEMTSIAEGNQIDGSESTIPESESDVPAPVRQTSSRHFDDSVLQSPQNVSHRKVRSVSLDSFATRPSFVDPQFVAPALSGKASIAAPSFLPSLPSTLSSLIDDASKSLLTNTATRELAQALGSIRAEFDAQNSEGIAVTNSSNQSSHASKLERAVSSGAHRRNLSHGQGARFNSSDAFRSLFLGSKHAQAPAKPESQGQSDKSSAKAAPPLHKLASLPFKDEILAHRKASLRFTKRLSRDFASFADGGNADRLQVGSETDSPVSALNASHNSTVDESFRSEQHDVRAPPTSPNEHTDVPKVRLPFSPDSAQPVAVEPSPAEAARPVPEVPVTPKVFKIFCTGHSLGGALASLAAYDLKINFKDPSDSADASHGGVSEEPLVDVQCYTFGSPRVGNLAYCRTYNETVPNSYRIVSDGDIVTSIPPKMVIMYKHAGQEVLVDQSGNYLLNPTFVEKSMRGARRSITDHALGTYIIGLDNAIQQHSEYAHQQKQINKAYQIYMKKHKDLWTAWNET